MSQCGGHQREWSALLSWRNQMERIMSKTNDTSNIATLNHQRTLLDDELDAITGGSLISTVLKDLHDIKSAIIRNIAG